jgi:hypothetical protein
MKKFIFPKEFRKIFILMSFLILLIAGGCFTIKYVIQPDMVSPNSAFNVKIVIKSNDDVDPADFWPACGYLGILLPDGWKVQDSIKYSKASGEISQKGIFYYHESVTLFLKSRYETPPAGYHWWGAISDNFIQLCQSDTGFVNITIITDSKLGQFKIKYVFGDDTDWNKQTYSDLFGVVTKSEFIPIKVDITQQSEKISNNEELVVFPNPATDAVTFSWKGNYNQLNLKIYQLNGACVIDRVISPHESVSVSDFPKGTYLFRLTNDNKLVENGKLVVD